jgi:phosphoglycerol transferase MdoB-like AlkP superfamily enzyme
MLTRVWFILKYWFIWILLFEVARAVFLFANFNEIKTATAAKSFLSLWYGLRMDLSMAAYITLPVAIMVLLSLFIHSIKHSNFYKVYTAIILFIILLFLFADIGLFQAWGSRLDTTLLKYIYNPKEVWASINHLPILGILTFFVLLYLLLLLGMNKLLKKATLSLHQPCKKWLTFITLIILTGLFIIPLRGGFQLAPLNQSSVYFSDNNFANMAALNAPWNFLHALNQHSNNTLNPYLVDTKEKVNAIRDSLLSKTNKTEQLVDLTKTATPNVIIIVWESFSAKIVGLQMEGKSITPGFNKLIKEGIYFSNIYATGDRTDKGIVGVLSGYPSQPTQSVLKEPAKAAKLPMISKMFYDKGYHTSFHYGGELEFANMKAYLLQGKFKQFITINDFEKKDQNSKWGAHDGVVMERFRNDINNLQPPFFSTWLTLSSHEPYEIPSAPLLQGKEGLSQFLSSIHYSDSIVNNFVHYAKTQAWWPNTLLLIVADHGHKLPKAIDKAEDFRIPLLILGGALNGKTATISKTGSQTDIASTLLAQLKIPANNFIWSKNLLDSTTSSWAFFSFNNGFGYLQPGKYLVFDNIGRLPIQKSKNITPKDIYIARALQQAAFQDYLDK